MGHLHHEIQHLVALGGGPKVADGQGVQHALQHNGRGDRIRLVVRIGRVAPGRPGLRQPPARLPVAVEVAVVDQPADGFPYAATALRIAIKAEMPGFGRQDESVGHRLMVRNEGPSVEVLQGSRPKPWRFSGNRSASPGTASERRLSRGRCGRGRRCPTAVPKAKHE